MTSFNNDFSQIEVKTIDNIETNQAVSKANDLATQQSNNQPLQQQNNKNKSIEIYKELESEETNDSKGEEEQENEEFNEKKHHKISFDTQKTHENTENQQNNKNTNNNNQDNQQTNIQNQNIHQEKDHYLSQELVFLYQPRMKIDKSENAQFIHKEYQYTVHTIGRIKSIEDYLSIYLQMEPPSKWNDDIKIGLFKKNEEPKWELYQKGGCLIMKFPKNLCLEVMDQIWEETLISIIGDHIKQSNKIVYDNIVGILMNIRFKENFLEIWLKDSHLKFETALEIKNYLDICDKQPFYFKLHQKSIQKQSLKKEMEKLKYDDATKSYKIYQCSKKKRI
ncbi:Translation Initiation factor eIF- 4e-like domain [Pseudocohnilembus persalinus]|uniref:Translation Initiation factor eIF-4e-like domain n=1 Tax=Pseudocohnilembus persalinus TaxID=266149 RepID=A0A0V0QC53_PSEPJ|nr:Translation Initiation factor eIF- 4e-like domain [Pseudocohnilembus persalinus]|eukprot:KRW99811.1 Translation Initiation factor eIF- 4e-like domain [Pseudocohnilembus persalinus]